MIYQKKILSTVALAALPFYSYGAGVSGISSGIGSGADIEELVVNGSGKGLVGEAVSASVGTVSSEQLKHRPILRPAEVMETVPGLIVTQHSGDGKANQYFLRGFNLDHGTDFSTFVDGLPVNMVTHGHGQGYSDLNFLIPELVDNIVYQKGPYYAQEGDFSSAGTGRIQLKTQLDKSLIRFTAGADDYRRLVAMDQFAIAQGELLAAVEYQQTDGPWDLAEDLSRKNIVLKYRQQGNSHYVISAMAYKADWLATDQIPQRLVDSGEIDRFGFVTDTSGGDTHRYSLAFDWQHQAAEAVSKANAYVMDYELRLTSNPTYFLSDPVAGDEFTQIDKRKIWGASYSLSKTLSDKHRYELGAVVRYDDIDDVGVGPSQSGRNTSFTVRHSVSELATAAYASLQTQWLDWLTTTAGVRYDRIGVDVKPVGGGANQKDHDDLISPKLSVQLGPWSHTELFINYGKSFHSNDARGVVAAVEPVPLFAKSEGAEFGLRSAVVENVQLSLAVFALDLDSELIFVGDDGTTEPRGATRRTGWELGIFYQPKDWLIIDLDVTESKAHFKQELNGHSQRVPDAVENVMSLGMTVDFPSGWHGGLRWRYLGGRSLVEDNSVRTDSTSVLNMNGGYRFANGWSLGLEVINLLDSEDNDITYLFESLTASELAAGSSPVEDKHFHPVEPRTLRATIGYEF